MNIYYVKAMKLHILRVFGGIFARTLPCCAVATLLLALLHSFVPAGNWMIWIAKVICFVVIYGLLLLVYGLNANEKQILFGRLSRAKRK